jgi:hypothetical protein
MQHVRVMTGGAMTTREFLTQYKKLSYTVENLEREIEELEARVTSIRSTIGDGMPRGSAAKDQTEILIAALVDKKRDKAKKLRKAEKIRLDIENVIEMIQDPIYQRLLKDWYIRGMRWWEITTDLHMTSDDYVRGKLRWKAEQAAEEALKAYRRKCT